MKLSAQETAQFFRILWSVSAYVNNKFGISDGFDAQVESNKVMPATVVPIYEKLWEDDSLLLSFVSDNPAKLSDEDLDIAASWKYRIEGNFFVYKFLSKYTVFIDDKAPHHAYGVCGITNPIEEIFIPPLPALVKTVLLPFKDKITYDGILNTYNVQFGSGYRSNLDFAYRSAKERDGIITSLIPQKATERSQKSFADRNNLILKAFSKHLSKSGLSPKMVQQHTANIEIFSNKYLMDFTPPGLLLDIEGTQLADYFDNVLVDLKTRKTNSVSFKRFVRFLTETGRLNPDDYWELIDLLKEYKE